MDGARLLIDYAYLVEQLLCHLLVKEADHTLLVDVVLDLLEELHELIDLHVVEHLSLPILIHVVFELLVELVNCGLAQGWHQDVKLTQLVVVLENRDHLLEQVGTLARVLVFQVDSINQSVLISKVFDEALRKEELLLPQKFHFRIGRKNIVCLFEVTFLGHVRSEVALSETENEIQFI